MQAIGKWESRQVEKRETEQELLRIQFSNNNDRRLRLNREIEDFSQQTARKFGKKNNLCVFFLIRFNIEWKK